MPSPAGMADATAAAAGSDSAVVGAVGMEKPAERGAPSWPLAVTRVSFFATGAKMQLAMDSQSDLKVCSLRSSFEKTLRLLHVVYPSPARDKNRF